MRELREHNECLLLNILPAHVAQHFLQRDRNDEVATSRRSRCTLSECVQVLTVCVCGCICRSCTLSPTTVLVSSSPLCPASPPSTSRRRSFTSMWSVYASSTTSSPTLMRSHTCRHSRTRSSIAAKVERDNCDVCVCWCGAAAGRVLLPGRGEDKDHRQLLHGGVWPLSRQGGQSW